MPYGFAMSEGFVEALSAAVAAAGDTPQDMADNWAKAAQKFVGYWHGHGVEGYSQSSVVTFDPDQPWEEPLDDSDDCLFCSVMTEEDVERRIAGFQHAMNIEVRRTFRLAPELREQIGNSDSTDMNWSEYHEWLQKALALDPDHFEVFPYSFPDLPYYLKYRLCVLWNHVLRDWLTVHTNFSYDWDKRRVVETETRESLSAKEEKEVLADDIAYAQSVPAPITEDLAELIAQEYEEGMF